MQGTRLLHGRETRKIQILPSKTLHLTALKLNKFSLLLVFTESINENLETAMASSDEEGRKETCKMPCTGEWSLEAVDSLLQAYGQKYALGRGFLRNKDWEDVMALVNSRCSDPRFRKTMKQCRDKVDSLKKRYKVEKRKAVDTGFTATSWRYFHQMDDIMCRNHIKDTSLSPSAGAESSADRKMESLGLELGLGLGPKKRSRDEMSCDPMEALAEAIVGFSNVYARMEIAKMDILSNMNVQLARLVRRKRRNACHSSNDDE
ncbi:hypothetical protein SUGI_0284920 [Cryptomeria japonica]|uniref:trihelix transcription factor ENAP2 n=1 Tax=Cryptomeria japonica TaxID=3369 RepID=UPI002408D0F7|nr:trihelix transcription factor ENAP2 [Cryptomeria japonica]GLJ16612.1 hypothetical protein SUGI_0284920 [Cryptomeria japonica]